MDNIIAVIVISFLAGATTFPLGYAMSRIVKHGVRFGMWTLKIGAHPWCKGVSWAGVGVKIFDPIEDYPSGWSTVYLIYINILKGEYFISLEKE